MANPGGVFTIWTHVKFPSFTQSLKRRPILKTALLAAIPIEIVNFWVIGYPAGAHGLTSASQNAAVALQWYLLHLPGIIASDRSILLRAHPVPCSLVLLIAGFIDTSILLAAAIWTARLALRTLSKLSSPMKPAL